MLKLSTKHGQSFSFTNGRITVVGKVSTNGINTFLCQNISGNQGYRCPNNLGFSSAYFVGKNPTLGTLIGMGFSNFQLITVSTVDASTYKDFKVGDKIKNTKTGATAVVSAVENNIVNYTNAKDQASNNFTMTELFRRGWRLDVVAAPVAAPAPKLTVLTLAQIAAQNGIPVSQLRVKD